MRETLDDLIIENFLQFMNHSWTICASAPSPQPQKTANLLPLSILDKL